MARLLLILFSLLMTVISYSQEEIWKELPDSLQLQINGLQDSHEKIDLLLEYADKNHYSSTSTVISVLQILERYTEQNDNYGMSKVYHYYALCHFINKDWETSISYGQKGLSITDSIKDMKQYALFLGNMSNVYSAMSQNEMANDYRLRCRSMYVSMNDTLGLAILDNDLGLYYFDLGGLSQSMYYFQQALRGLELKNHIIGKLIVLNNIGRILQQQKDYEASRQYYRQSYQLALDKDNQAFQATALNNIGASFQDEAVFDSAFYYHNLSLDIKNQIGNISGIANTLNNLCIIANIQEQYSDALELCNKSIDFAQKSNDKETEAHSWIEGGKALAGLSAKGEAATYLNKGLVLSKEAENVLHEQTANQALYQLYKSSDPKKAIVYLEKSVALKDSILNKANIRTVTQMEKDFEFEKVKSAKQQEISLLSTQNELQEVKIKSGRRNLIFSSFGLLLLGLFSYFMFRSRAKVSHLNQELQAKNLIIEKALHEKDTLLKEIHHRVKNNLQVISSLLGIQSRQVSDPAAKEALNEGRSRVQSMSLIHQDLYQQDNLKGIYIKDYFDKLTTSLFSTYSLKRGVKIKSDIDPLILDVDTVIPLGLIINELVTNALKYAFDDNVGTILVSLKEINGSLQLIVQDDGRGMDDVSGALSGDSYGYELIQALVDKLDGALDITIDQGSTITATFKKYQKAA